MGTYTANLNALTDFAAAAYERYRAIVVNQHSGRQPDTPGQLTGEQRDVIAELQAAEQALADYRARRYRQWAIERSRESFAS